MEADNRFRVTYRIFASDQTEANARAKDIALEQTVEVPDDVVPEGFIRDEIVGQIETVEQQSKGSFEAIISYSPDSAGHEVVQLINVIFGNTSIQQNVRVVGFDAGPEITRRFTGARFGIDGLRTLTGRANGGLISPVIKPQGSSASQLALIASRCVAGGADVIKDDHGMANQPMAPFEDRLKAVSDAVGEANVKHDRNALYFVNVTGHSGNVVDEAFRAKEVGAGGVLLMPGLIGYSAMQHLANNAEFGLPIMTHPAFTGPFVLTPTTGISHAIMYGTLQRLAGSDISVFPNVGGRFGFTRQECLSIADACRLPGGVGAPIMPSPGGGMTADRAHEMVSMYGEDVVFLLGGSLLRSREKIGDTIKSMREAIDNI